MKLIVRVDGNAKIGMGHFYRCLSLANMCKESFSITFAMAGPGEGIKEILKESQIELIELKQKQYLLPEEKENSELDFDLDDEIDKYDVIVLDGYWFGLKYQEKLRKFDITVVFIDDFASDSYNADIILNHAPGIAPANYKITNDATLLLGPDYALLRPVFLNYATKEKAPLKNINKVFICFGGSDYYNFTENITELLLKSTTYELCVVVGAANQNKEPLNALAKVNDERVKLYYNVSEIEMAELMTYCDFGIVPASGIIYEAMAVGLPVISGRYTDNQNNFYYGLRDKDGFIDAGRFTEQELESAIKEVTVDKINDLRLRISKILDGDSGHRINKAIKNKIFFNLLTLRKATLEDTMIYFNWANDVEVRKNAFNSEPIQWEDHNIWFQKKIETKNSRLFIGIIKNEPVGQIRLDKVEKSWYIDYSVDKNYRGLGLGKVLVKKALQFAKKENLSPISAEVKPDNLPSVKVFENLNFKKQRQTNEKLLFQYE